jgi:hypothetical protein
MGLNKISCQSCGQTLVGTAGMDGLCPACGNKLDGSGRQATGEPAVKMPWHLRNASLTWGLALLCVAGLLQLAGYFVASSLQDEVETRTSQSRSGGFLGGIAGDVARMKTMNRLAEIQIVCNIATVPPLAVGVVLLCVVVIKKVRRRPAQ